MDFRPLRQLKGEGGTRSYSFGPHNVLRVAPRISELVGRLVGLHAAMDIAAARFVVNGLGADPLMSADIMMELDANPSIRRKLAFRVAAGRFREAESDRQQVRTVLGRWTHAENIRRRLVHDYWATSLDHPEVLLLIPSRRMVDHHGALEHMKETVLPVQDSHGYRKVYLPDDDFPHDRLSMDEAVFCRTEDLEKHVTYFHKTLRLLEMISRLASTDADEAQKARSQLSSEL